MAADDRVRGLLLAGLTVAALVVGGWWWREAAPAIGPVRPLPSPSPAESMVGQVVLVDPATGRVVDRLETDREDPVIPHQGAGAAQVNPARTVWQDRSHLSPDADPLVRQVDAAPDGRFLLTIGCNGQGTVTVTYSGAYGDESEPLIACPTAAQPFALTASGGPMLVRFTVSGDEVDLNARLASML
ncbi:hypothetical protein ABZ671_10895 [Micromonospora sp. NPDC006766]|uniref:hypothetical protein n=1 Tax=Micromonospora sp. NPDC006766 TaxID=3154778 RepID=UPI0033F561C5